MPLGLQCLELNCKEYICVLSLLKELYVQQII